MNLKYRAACAATLATLFILTVWVVLPVVFHYAKTPQAFITMIFVWGVVAAPIGARAILWTVYDSWRLKQPNNP